MKNENEPKLKGSQTVPRHSRILVPILDAKAEEVDVVLKKSRPKAAVGPGPRRSKSESYYRKKLPMPSEKAQKPRDRIEPKNQVALNSKAADVRELHRLNSLREYRQPLAPLDGPDLFVLPADLPLDRRHDALLHLFEEEARREEQSRTLEEIAKRGPVVTEIEIGPKPPRGTWGYAKGLAWITPEPPGRKPTKAEEEEAAALVAYNERLFAWREIKRPEGISDRDWKLYKMVTVGDQTGPLDDTVAAGRLQFPIGHDAARKAISRVRQKLKEEAMRLKKEK